MRTLTILCLLALIGCATEPQSTEESLNAAVFRIKGFARRPTDQKGWQALKVGDVFGAGALLQTAMERGTYVDLIAPPPTPVIASLNSAPRPPTGMENRLWLPPPSSVEPRIQRDWPIKTSPMMVRLWENTVLRLDQLTQRKSPGTKLPSVNARLNLQSGRLTVGLEGEPYATVCEVQCTNCLVKVRAGMFDITHDGVLRVARGTASVTQQDGRVIEVPDRYRFDARTGATDPLPKEMTTEIMQ